MVVEEDGRRGVAPVRPVGESRESGAGGRHEGLTIDQVEGVLEVDLEEGEVGLGVALKNIPQGVGHDLDTPGATHTVVPSLEDGGDLILACHAKALCNEATEGISATQGTDTLVGLSQRDGHATCEEGLEEGG